MAGKASDKIQYYQNPSGPTIGTVGRKVIEKDGFYFKDLDGSGNGKNTMTGGFRQKSVRKPM